METLAKNWQSGVPTQKKFLSRLITHRLSNLLDNKKFEVVFEGHFDAIDENEPDVIVYEKGNKVKPVMALEISYSKESDSLLSKAKEMMTNFKLENFFIYNFPKATWTNLHREANEVSVSSSSTFKDVSLSDVVKLV